MLNSTSDHDSLASLQRRGRQPAADATSPSPSSASHDSDGVRRLFPRSARGTTGGASQGESGGGF